MHGNSMNLWLLHTWKRYPTFDLWYGRSTWRWGERQLDWFLVISFVSFKEINWMIWERRMTVHPA